MVLLREGQGRAGAKAVSRGMLWRQIQEIQEIQEGNPNGEEDLRGACGGTRGRDRSRRYAEEQGVGGISGDGSGGRGALGVELVLGGGGGRAVGGHLRWEARAEATAARAQAAMAAKSEEVLPRSASTDRTRSRSPAPSNTAPAPPSSSCLSFVTYLHAGPPAPGRVRPEALKHTREEAQDTLVRWLPYIERWGSRPAKSRGQNNGSKRITSP